MKRTLAIVTFLLAAAGAHAQSGGMDMKDTDMDKAPAAKKAASHNGVGTVRKVDTGKGMVTIAHGPVPSMNWPAMTMTFDVKDKTILENIRPGAAVQFEFVQQGSRYTLTSIR